MVTEYDGVIGEDIPAAVNGWMYSPDASWNGDVWRNAAEEIAVVVFDHGAIFDTSVVKVYDERVGGMNGGIVIDDSPTVTDESSITPPEARSRAINWMQNVSPTDWKHPLVSENVFRAPHGFSVEHYYIESQEDIVIYHRECLPVGITSQKIEISGHRSTGNYTISVEEYGQTTRADLSDFSRELEGVSLETAVDFVCVVAAKLLTTPRN